MLWETVSEKSVRGLALLTSLKSFRGQRNARLAVEMTWPAQLRRLGKNSLVCSSTAAKLLDETFAFTAQDKKKALRLKSHVRVISSHEPVRAPQSARDTKSSYESAKTQSPGQSSLDSHGTAVVESSLLTDNFKELLHDPVEVQLQKLLGADAEDFLHPTFREGAKKTLNPMATQRKRTYFKNLFRVGTRARAGPYVRSSCAEKGMRCSHVVLVWSKWALSGKRPRNVSHFPSFLACLPF